jgi:hypothetical protein
VANIKPMVTLKDILNNLNQPTHDELKRDRSPDTPVRLPNADWHDDDPAELIDFPVADCWLDSYYTRGMTPRHTTKLNPRFVNRREFRIDGKPLNQQPEPQTQQRGKGVNI